METVLSIIIPYHNEGKSFVMECINQIKITIDVDKYEIIVIDDFSDTPLNIEEKYVKIIRQSQNMGVGLAFDRGVSESQYENIFLTASDVRFVKNNWASKIVEEIIKHPKSIICTTCVGLNADNMNLEKRRHTHRCQGANVLIFHDHKTHPKKPENFRNIIEGQWRSPLNVEKSKIDSFDIQCLMGAAYGVSKEWYTYIDGFAGHKLWGTLEPYISLKSWFFGGSIRLAPQIETGHIFKASGTHGTPATALLYNKMFVSLVLFNERDATKLISFLGTNGTVEAAKKMINDNIDYIHKKQIEYRSKIVGDYHDFIKRFNIDFRE